MASPADVEKGMKMAEQEMEYRVDLFNKYARKDRVIARTSSKEH